MHTFRPIILAFLHWLLQLAFFGMGCFAIGGAFEAMLFTILALIASAPLYIFSPLILRLVAALHRPRLAMAATLCTLLGINDWIFHGLAYKASDPLAQHYSSEAMLNFSTGFNEGAAEPFRLCLWAATVLATVVMSKPLTAYFRSHASAGHDMPDTLNTAPV